jgi:hypothetical protein
VKVGWFFIALGLAMGAIFQHADAYVFGVGMLLFGAWVLSVREEAK